MKLLYFIGSIFLVVVGCQQQSTTLIDIEGNTYPSKEINGQTWMLENLKVTKTPEGDLVNTYFPNEDPNNLEAFGLLYDYETACKVCPEGWRLPENEDWESLLDMNNAQEATKFKDPDYWSNDQNSNQAGFFARPAGYGNQGEHDNNFRSNTLYWSKTKDDEFSWTYIFESGNNAVRKASQHGTYAFSVRCVKID